ncbi:15780_t:CDS:2 [Cetraspora pellucida]|uniref:15780_t:CDS:1 n=1 Tax=Cetraspora pellucida TaxID=1433469 RepID=A0A9N9BLX8_9GLOM|nr:15780_t:CDS:2 [Cetraspora pellucida]
MPRRTKNTSVSSKTKSLENKIANLEAEQLQLVDVLRSNYIISTKLSRMTAERNTFRVKVANLEDEVIELRRWKREKESGKIIIESVSTNQTLTTLI